MIATDAFANGACSPETRRPVYVMPDVSTWLPDSILASELARSKGGRFVPQTSRVHIRRLLFHKLLKKELRPIRYRTGRQVPQRD